jgi:hypothetical protein
MSDEQALKAARYILDCLALYKKPRYKPTVANRIKSLEYAGDVRYLADRILQCVREFGRRN